jgi:hypothetical protein
MSGLVLASRELWSLIIGEKGSWKNFQKYSTTTFSKTTLSITSLSIMTLRIIALSRITLSITFRGKNWYKITFY